MNSLLRSFSIFIFIIFVQLDYPLFGQTFWECETEGPDQDYLKKNGIMDYTHNLDSATIKIFIHLVRRSNGSGGLSSNQLDDAIQVMESDYATGNISFVELGREYIDDDDIFFHFNDTTDVATFADLISINPHENAIDIYFLPSIYDYAKAVNIPGLSLVLGGARAGTSVLSHEMGHCLGLYHTHSGSGCGDNRNKPDSDGSECMTKGDLVCDTPPDPCLTNNVNSQCQYTGPSGYNPDVENIMSYTPPECMQHLTTGQFDRIFTMLENSEVLYNVYYDIEVLVNQLLSDGTLIDSIGFWNSNQFTIYPCSSTFYLATGRAEVFQGSHKLISNQKYNNWNELSDVTNHHKFDIVSDQSELTSKFRKTYENIVIKTQLVSGGSGGEIKFKDPWLADYPDPEYGNTKRNRGMKADGDDQLLAKERTSPFYPDFTTNYNGYIYKGIFLEQGFPNWNPPYYSVAVDEVQPISFHNKSVNWHFQGWTGENVEFQDASLPETPIVFKNANAQARALYKGHLASTNFRATGFNSSRRVYLAPGGDLHLVYEDAGSIWYTISSDNGKTWLAETRLSPLSYTNDDGYVYSYCNPAISGFGTSICVTWENVIQWSTTSFDRYISFRKKENGAWGSETAVSSGQMAYGLWNGPNSERPSIASTEINQIVVAWHDKDNQDIKMRFLDASGWSNIISVAGNGIPVAGIFTHDALSNVRVLWSENGNLFVKNAQFHNGGWTLSSTYNLTSDAFDFENNVHPSMALNTNGTAHIVWEADNWITYEKHLLYQGYDFANAPTPQTTRYTLDLGEFDADFGHAVVASNPLGDTQTVFYEQDGNIFRKQKSNSWQTTSFSDGRSPSIAPNAELGAVWTRYASVPYLLKTDHSEFTLPPVYPPKYPVKPYPILLYHLEAAENGGNDGYIQLELKQALFDTSQIFFNSDMKSDTLIADVSVIPVEIELMATFYNVNTPPNTTEKLFEMGFLDGVNEIPLIDLQMNDLPDTTLLFTKSINKTNLHYRVGQIQLTFNGRQPSLLMVVPDSTTTAPLNKGNSAPMRRNLPGGYQLRQNYPNPFNPLTNIAFSIPHSEQAVLDIFNVNGKKVNEAFKGFLEAGYYEVLFNGSTLPSGVYFYRLKAGNFIQTKRMLLIK